MNRRKFLQRLGLGGVGVAALGLGVRPGVEPMREAEALRAPERRIAVMIPISDELLADAATLGPLLAFLIERDVREQSDELGRDLLRGTGPSPRGFLNG